MINYKNFKCEDCGEDKFTMLDTFNLTREITLKCSNKDCGASYDFSPTMSLSNSSHPAKRCKCGSGLLGREDKFCKYCGEKNPDYKEYTAIKNYITDEDLDDEIIMKGGNE